MCRVRRRAHLRGGLDAGRIGVAPTACGVRWAAPWGRSGVVPAGRRPGGAAAREGGRGPVLARRSRYDHRQNWWRLSEPTFLRGPPCSKLGGGRPGAAAGGRRGARPLSGHSPKVAFTSKSQRKRLQTARVSRDSRLSFLRPRVVPRHARLHRATALLRTAARPGTANDERGALPMRMLCLCACMLVRGGRVRGT